jgi:hypothetical protein
MKRPLRHLVRPWPILAAAVVLGTATGTGPVAAQGSADPANEIIAAAIARKHALLATLHDYEYQVSVKFVVHDLGKQKDSAASVALIRESRSNVYWQAPDHYHETIVARRQANHLNPLWDVVFVDDIAAFQQDRVEIRAHSFVSPIADGALDHYNFRMLDTLAVEGRRVLRLAMVPRSQTTPSFTGVIDIADSTWDVVAIDVAVNDAARFGLWKQIRYQVHFEEMGDGRWMPRGIRFTGEARLRLPIPRTPRHLVFEQEALFTDYRFDTGERPGGLTEVRVAVDAQADHADSAAWAAPGAIPLTDAESQGWRRNELAQQQPTGFISRARRAADQSQFVLASPDFFHFNRVDGAYFGAGSTWRQTPDLTVTAKIGYATGSDRWQYRGGANLQVSEAKRIWIGASYHDETVNRPGLIPHSVDRTLQALLYRRDPLDYYRERGLTLSFALRPLNFTLVDLHYNDQQQSELPVITDYSLLPADQPQRANGFIVAGRMRTLSGSFTYDSRSLLRRDGQDTRLPSRTWTRMVLSTEVASPSLIANDFNFARYTLQVERHQRTSAFGMTAVSALFGITTGTVPPQRYFTIESGVRALGFQGNGFTTLRDTGFAGNRVAMVSVRHDFDRLLFAKSGLPLIRKLPFTLRVYAGMFAIGFADHTPLPSDSAFRTTSSPYTEAGFVLGDLMPFIAPLNLGAQFTWQLSAQLSRRFQFGFNLGLPGQGIP